MIKLRQITKVYPTRSGYHTMLDGIDFTIRPGEKIGILGRNGAGKPTLIRILSGAERPTRGQVHRGMGCRQNIAYVEDFSELGEYMREPVRMYSSGMRMRPAFATSMAVEFDCFLIDEVITVGDDRFRAKCQHELFDKRKDRAFIIESHDAHIIRKHCDRAGVPIAGKMHLFDDVDAAYAHYQEAAA